MGSIRGRDIGKTCSGIIFTDYADTAEYLMYLAQSRGLNAFALTGTTTAEQKERALDRARSTPTLLILTGALEGTDIGFVNQVIHYDLPWNPNALQQRIGRVDRVGSHFDAFYHYFIVGQEEASHDIIHLLTELRTIEDEWESGV